LIISHVVMDGIPEAEKTTRAYRYLKEIRVIVETLRGVELTVPLFAEVVRQEQHIGGFRVMGNTIYFDDKNLNHLFTLKEQYLLSALLNKKEQIVSREELAQALWGKDWQEEYSDWALDQGVHRLRLVLEQSGFNKQLIKTVKGKGVRFG
jgi:DNA-binding winged helix-turn-helix (wHTH) protein